VSIASKRQIDELRHTLADDNEWRLGAGIASWRPAYVAVKAPRLAGELPFADDTSFGGRGITCCPFQACQVTAARRRLRWAGCGRLT
jgi:hypothetical protein